MEIGEDLRLAARVQRSLAPRPLTWNGMGVDSFNHPVHTIGGDFALQCPEVRPTARRVTRMPARNDCEQASLFGQARKLLVGEGFLEFGRGG
jgi:hypothetical protein